jgi:hypothetical protein
MTFLFSTDMEGFGITSGSTRKMKGVVNFWVVDGIAKDGCYKDALSAGKVGCEQD